VKPADGRSLLGTVAQLPVFLGLFAAIRRGLGSGGGFLWIRNIALPDLPLAVLCGGLTALSTALAPQLPASQRALTAFLPAVLTLFVLSRLAAGLSIYAAAQGLVGLGQTLLVRRRAGRLLPA
jgi:YidC/Oxa1 family membrane protein insertase